MGDKEYFMLSCSRKKLVGKINQNIIILSKFKDSYRQLHIRKESFF